MTGPIWKSFRELVLLVLLDLLEDFNSVGVFIPAMRSLAELVVDPPGDGPSKGSLPTGRAIIPALCAADPDADDFLDLTEADFADPLCFFTPSAKSGYLCDILPLCVAVLLLSSDLTDCAFTISFLTGMATAEPTENDFADAPDLGSDLARCI